jgi:uncharacterized protein (DUF2141 family)
MNNQLKITLIVLVLTYPSTTAKGQQAEILTFKITHLKSWAGRVMVSLFRQEDDLPKKPFKTKEASILNGIAYITFEDVPMDDDAAIGYHDRNANGMPNHKLGFPNEPMDFSNHWRLTLFSGMPSFKKLKFKFTRDNTVIEIPID